MEKHISRAEFIEQLLADNLVQTRHNAVYDYAFQKALAAAPWQQWLSEPGYFEVAELYKSTITDWIQTNSCNSVTGIRRFKHRDLINGTTQAFDEAYYRYKTLRLRTRRGEYAYHKRVVTNSVFLEDEPLQRGDWIILSWPFCGTGDNPKDITVLLDSALDLDVPVLIDCAWYGTCRDIHIDLTHPAITEAAFSLTKSTGTGNIRSGVRYSNYEDNLPIRQQNNYNHLVLGAAQIGLWMMQHFPSDWQAVQYTSRQQKLCDALGVTASKCVHIALADGSAEWHKQFLIDGAYYKLGLKDALKAVRKNQLTWPTN